MMHAMLSITEISTKKLLLICHVQESATASSKDLLTVAQENSTNQTGDVLVEDQLQPPLDLVSVSQEQELH